MSFPGSDFMRQFTVGLALVIASVFLTSVLAVFGMRRARAVESRLAGVYARSALASRELESQLERRSGFAREYSLTGDERALQRAEEEATTSFEQSLPQLRLRARNSEGRALLDRIDAAEAQYAGKLREAMALRARGDPGVTRAFEHGVVPAKDQLASLLSAYEALTEQQFIDAEATSTADTSRDATLVGVVAALALISATALAALLWRGVRALAQGKTLLAGSLARVEQSNRDLDAFAGRVAHDLRGALGPVLIAPKLLRPDNLSAERIDVVRGRLERAVERATGLIDALLAFSRAGAVPDPNAAASARAVVVDAVATLDRNVAQADASVSVDVDDALVRCPPGLLYVLLSNLAGNSIKFVQGRPCREIAISGRASRGGYELRIDDTGPGIPEDARERIFEPFYRVPGTVASGTGIGLATVRRVVDVYGGRISVESTLGSHSSFRVWLPLAGEVPEIPASDPAVAVH
jgi:signal transduction histidine kinase